MTSSPWRLQGNEPDSAGQPPAKAYRNSLNQDRSEPGGRHSRCVREGMPRKHLGIMLVSRRTPPPLQYSPHSSIYSDFPLAPALKELPDTEQVTSSISADTLSPLHSELDASADGGGLDNSVAACGRESVRQQAVAASRLLGPQG